MSVGGLLLDLEGVLYQEGEAISGAIASVHSLAEAGLQLRFLTNTTTRPRAAIVERMRALGFDVTPEQVFTPALAAGHLLTEGGARRLHLAAPEELAADFSAFDLVDEEPEAVVLGDLHTEFTWDRLDGLFRMVFGGALWAGLQAVQVMTGKYSRRDDNHPEVRPTGRVASIAELAAWLDGSD